MSALTNVERRIRWAAVFLLAGLVVQGLSLLRVAALSFVVFTTLGLLLLAIGAVIFLFSLLEAGPDDEK
ncbi:MAG TPA: hypothetical protein VKF80_10425 [Candidatus Eisenbacteria bacterium]|nr:hypothetical protein [Candidatus Eisenbacteria bacterium]